MDMLAAPLQALYRHFLPKMNQNQGQMSSFKLQIHCVFVVVQNRGLEMLRNKVYSLK